MHSIAKVFLSFLVCPIFQVNIYAQGILGKDTLVCDKDFLQLTSKLSGNSYLWSTDEASPSIIITESGSYIVSVNTNSGFKTDTITVKFLNSRFRQANNWFLGNNAGLVFANNPATPVVATNNFPPHQLNKSNAIVSDNEGKLLFYSDGRDVFSADGSKIFNISPNPSEQFDRTLLIHKPGSERYFYLFNVDNEGKLFYTLIDRFLNSGKGGAVAGSTNILLSNNATAITAFKTQHENAFWLVTHESNSNKFLAFKFSKNAISSAVVSETGTVVNSNISTLKFSVSGGQLILNSSVAELFNFDLYSGKVVLERRFDLPVTHFQGAAFSPDGSKLYLSGQSSSEAYLFQIDLFFRSSNVLTYPYNSVKSSLQKPYGMMQLAPDGKIYIARSGESFLSEITNTAQWPLDGNLKNEGINLNGGISSESLPNFPLHYFASPPSPSVYADNKCDKESVKLLVSTDLHLFEFAKTQITFGTGDNGKTINTGNVPEVFYQYPSYGKYKIAATLQTTCTTFVLRYDHLTIFPEPKLDFKDTTVCPNPDDIAKLSFDAQNENFTNFTPVYVWRSKDKIYDSVRVLKPQDLGTYYAKVMFDKCIATDSFRIIGRDTPIPELGIDKKVCKGEPVVLRPNVGNSKGNFTWQNGSTVNELNVQVDGLYKVTFNDGKCTTKDSVKVNFFDPPVNPNFPALYNICFDSILTLTASLNANYSYNWSTGETSAAIKVSKAGNYELSISNQGCIKIFQTQVKKFPPLVFNFTETMPICFRENSQIELDAGEGVSFQWLPDLQTTRSIFVDTGFYQVVKIDQNKCKAKQSVQVYLFCEPKIYIPTAFSPNEDKDNELFMPVVSNIENYEILIFNKWGEVIFTSKEIDKGWDGTHLGMKVPTGGYTYLIRYFAEENNTMKEFTKKGIVNLLR